MGLFCFFKKAIKYRMSLNLCGRFAAPVTTHPSNHCCRSIFQNRFNKIFLNIAAFDPRLTCLTHSLTNLLACQGTHPQPTYLPVSFSAMQVPGALGGSQVWTVGRHSGQRRLQPYVQLTSAVQGVREQSRQTTQYLPVSPDDVNPSDDDVVFATSESTCKITS